MVLIICGLLLAALGPPWAALLGSPEFGWAYLGTGLVVAALGFLTELARSI